jgi:3-methyladenine DNA glycosylase Mpg
MDYHRFFNREPEQVAQDLLGRLIIRKTDSGIYAAEVKITAAYRGGERTSAREGMMYDPGKLFLMPYRGHLFFNIATGGSNPMSCVEIREVSGDKRISGPGSVTKFLQLAQNSDGKQLGGESEVYVSEEPYRTGKIAPVNLEGKADNLVGAYRLE